MHRTTKIFLVAGFLALYLAAVSVHPVWAQSVLEGKLTGTVSDDKGELLPGATAEITGPSLMGKRSAVTSARGIFVFLNVPSGKFKLTVGLPGFKTYVQEDIILGAGSAVELKVIMELGAIEEQVTVVAASPIVDVKTSTVDSRLESEMLAKLPTTRDAFYDLSLTTPGMFDVGSSAGWLPSPTAYGGSSMENVFLVNGVNTTNPRGAAFGPLVKVNYNAVEEVRVVSIGARAEYGSYSGAAIDVLTKSGSNNFHGNAAYYTELKSWFKTNQPADGQLPNDSWLFVQPGDVLAGTTKTNWEGNFTLGGPILKDRIWFFGAFDYIRSDSLPVNWSRLNTYTGRYFDAKISAEPFRNHRAWVNYHYEHNSSMGWSWGSEPEWDTTMTYGPETYNNTISAQWQFLPTSSMIFTAKYLGFWTDDQPHIPTEGRIGHPGYINWWKWGTQYGINGDFPYVEAQKSNRATIQADMSYYAEDFLGEHDIKFGVQYTKGRGNWMGGYFQNYANFTYPLGGWWGYDTGRINIDYLLGYTWYANNAIQDGLLFYNNKTEMNPFLTVRTADSLGFFVDDQWSPTKRLTLNLGLRYDWMTTKYDKGKVYEFVTSAEQVNDPPPVLRERAGTDNIFDFKTLAPRLGLTYQLTEDGKTVFRANYGRYYMPLSVEYLRRFGPDMQLVNLAYQIYMIPWDIADINGDGYIDIYPVNGVSELQEAVRQIYGRNPIEERLSQTDPSWTLSVAPGVKDMYTDQLSLNLEREIVKDFSVSGTYIYKHAANLFVNVPINRETGEEWEYERIPFEIEPGNTVSLYSIIKKDYNDDGVVDGADIAWIGEHNTFRVENQQEYDGKKPQRTYQALQMVFNKRYSNRWQGLASVVYSWSNGTAQRTMRQDDNMMGPMVTDDTWMGNLNYTINNMEGVLPFVPKWEFKASGSYTVPYIELDLGLRFRMHTGRPVWEWLGYPTITQWSGPGAEGAILPGGLVRIIKGTEPTYLPSLAIFDLRLEKAFKIKTYGAIHVVLDILNVFNRANVTNINIGNWGRITGLTDARRFRLNFMYQF